MPKDEAFSWMWPEACAMLARAERLNRQFFHVAVARARQPVWEPPVDVLETRGHVVVVVGLPGVDPQTVEAAIEDEALVVEGDRFMPRELGRIFVHRLELPVGRFERKVALPRGRYSDVQYAMDNGCLIVTLSKVF